MWTTADDLAIIEPRIIQLVRELTAAPDTDEVSDALKPVMAQVVDQAAASSQEANDCGVADPDAFDALMAQTGSFTPDMRDAMTDLACYRYFRPLPQCMTTSSTNPICAAANRPRTVLLNRLCTVAPSTRAWLGLMLGDILAATACIEIARRAARRLDNTDAINEAFLTMQREVEIGRAGTGSRCRINATRRPGCVGRHLAERLPVENRKLHHHCTVAVRSAAGADPAEAWQQALAVGRPLGLAFQLADDLLDVVGSSRNTGKPVGGDIREQAHGAAGRRTGRSGYAGPATTYRFV